jgi:hypothetical protein
LVPALPRCGQVIYYPRDYGILVVDQTDEPKLRILARKMRRYNPVPSRFGTGSRLIPITTVVEYPVHRNYYLIV